MKKVLLLVAVALMLYASPALAVCADTDKFCVDEWRIDYQDTMIPTSSAGQKIIMNNYTTNTTPYSFATQETGVTVVDNIGTKFILPRADAGLRFTIVSGYNTTSGRPVSTTVDTVDTSDIINYSISGTKLDAGDSVKSTGQAGDSVTLCGQAANQWAICGMKAVWTDNSTN